MLASTKFSAGYYPPLLIEHEAGCSLGPIYELRVSPLGISNVPSSTFHNM